MHYFRQALVFIHKLVLRGQILLEVLDHVAIALVLLQQLLAHLAQPFLVPHMLLASRRIGMNSRLELAITLFFDESRWHPPRRHVDFILHYCARSFN